MIDLGSGDFDMLILHHHAVFAELVCDDHWRKRRPALVWNANVNIITDELVKSHIPYVVHASTSSARTEYQ